MRCVDGDETGKRECATADEGMDGERAMEEERDVLGACSGTWGARSGGVGRGVKRGEAHERTRIAQGRCGERARGRVRTRSAQSADDTDNEEKDGNGQGQDREEASNSVEMNTMGPTRG